MEQLKSDETHYILIAKARWCDAASHTETKRTKLFRPCPVRSLSFHARETTHNEKGGEESCGIAQLTDRLIKSAFMLAEQILNYSPGLFCLFVYIAQLTNSHCYPVLQLSNFIPQLTT